MQAPLHPMSPRLLLAVLCASLWLPSLLTAQITYTWTGGSNLNGEFSNADNWLDGNIPPQLTGTNVLSLVFGESESGITDLTNNRTPMRLRDLIFSKDADAYEISGGSWGFYGNTLGTIRNLSQYEQVFTDTTFSFDNGNGYTFDTGYAGIRLDTTAAIAFGGGTAQLIKTGVGTLTLQGDNSGVRIFQVNLGTLLLDVEAGYIHSTTFVNSAVGMAGGELSILGKTWDDTTLDLGSFGHVNSSNVLVYAVSSSRSNRLTVDGNGDGTYRTQIIFSDWFGHSSYPGRRWEANGLSGHTTTLNFNLARNAGVHFDSLQSGILGVDNVIYWSTTTTTDSNGSNQRTGFTQLVGNVDDGYDVTRYEDYTLLPSLQSGLTGGHYYTAGDHTISGTAVTGANAARTLTLTGMGTLTVSGANLHLGNLLLQEGTGDYTISIPAANFLSANTLGTAAQHQQRGNSLTIHQYRTTGDLVIQGGGIAGTYLVTTGPGTVVLRTPTSTIPSLYIQEGRLQLESNAFSTVTAAHVYATLGGSAQIGSGAATVRIYEGGIVDATPSAHLTESGLRGLQIQGSLQLDDRSSFLMGLTPDVIANNYTPLRVTGAPTIASATESLLGVDLKLTLQDHLTSETWVTLLATDGTISGTFATVNGYAFGAGNHFVLTYDNVDYDAYIHYNYDLGDGLSGIVLQAIPEPTTITLLIGLLLAGCVYIRRRGRIA
jgi:hypothetical protein